MWWQLVLVTRGARATHQLRLQSMALVMAGILAAIFMGAGPAQAGLTKERRTIVRRVTSQIGTPYVYGAESPKKGFDCSGLTWWTYNGHGADLPRTSLAQYQLPKVTDDKRIKRRSDLVKGDLVFFKTTNALVGHVGIYVGDGDFVSATSSGGVRKASVRDPYYWGERWVGATRVLN